MKRNVVAEKMKWEKPEVKVEELTMRSLLGENGWFQSMTNGLVKPAFARSI